MRVGDDFRIRSNSELYEIDIVQRIYTQRLCWLGRVFNAGIDLVADETLSWISVPTGVGVQKADAPGRMY